ncbi:MAG: aminotransferase class I/II-fold pyridoxal phosphate-dependent enzyme [Chloroflexi bacterium]|nr:aminotransferase class I/II-fold pyridoxal phosphate-dependent enzyme [Chloroflexota bacterium]
MQAVILAAGLGKRLGATTRHSTKCMVELNGRRLVEYALDALIRANVERIVIVVGHGADEVRAFLGSEQAGIPVHYVTNPVYAETNNIYSLLLAREYLEQDDTLLLESDVIFEPEILLACASHPAKNVAVVAAYEPWMDGTVTVLDDDLRITRFVSKREFRRAEAASYFKTVNLYKLSRELSRSRLMPFLAAYVGMEGRGHYYEEVLRALVYMGDDNLVALPVGERRWYEIDDQQDLDIASVLFAPAEERFERLQKRYGGYWRFPRLKDFTYLVHPYFPSDGLREALSDAAPQLATMYPSGLAVQRSLAAGLFRCQPDQILVGNGAAELISAMLADISGPVIVPTPTFEEYGHYPEAVPMGPAALEPDTFRHDLDNLAQASRDQSAAALVLVNPNNPTGQTFRRDDILVLLETLRTQGTRLILDESFIDFVDGCQGRSLLDPETLARFPNLIVIRSLGKSHGIAGLRLGVLASGDAVLLQRIAGRLPIWNINALAEWFMQMVGRYECEYRAACHRLIENRAQLTRDLACLPGLRAIESGGNFVLCEVRPPWTAATLGQRLLTEHWLLVKDCTGKAGLGQGQYIRVAVKSEEENAALIQALQGLMS